MDEEDKKQLAIKRTVKLLDTEMKPKYPKNSMIVFSGRSDKGTKPGTVSCSWYNKVGRPDGKSADIKNIISKPPEWQNITYEEAEKITEMFDKCLFLTLNYV